MLSILTNPSVIAFIGVVIGSYLTYKFGIRNNNKRSPEKTANI